MRKIIIVFILPLIFILSSCYGTSVLNKDGYDTFSYNGSVYHLPDFDNSACKNKNGYYSFYGDRHFIGYTSWMHNAALETFILDVDTEENIIIQKGGDFWFKEGFEFPFLTDTTNISKMFINLYSYLDSEGEDWPKRISACIELELDNLTIKDLMTEIPYDKELEENLKKNGCNSCMIDLLYNEYILHSYSYGSYYDNENVYLVREDYIRDIDHGSYSEYHMFVFNKDYNEYFLEVLDLLDERINTDY